MSKYFFKPYIGPDYHLGLVNGKKTLVLGASFYCSMTDCKFYQDCTQNRNTSKYDLTCPYGSGRPLSESPSNECDENGAVSYSNFYRLMKDFLGKPGMSFDEFWESVAFTNYIQHFLGGRTITLKSDMSDYCMSAFEAVLDELKPDVVIVWGCVINGPIKNKKSCEDDPSFDNDFSPKEDYIFHWNYKGRKITFVNPYHPSSSDFASKANQETLKKYLEKAFNE